MKLTEAQQLIRQALTPEIDNWYTLDVVFNKEIEKVRIHEKHIDNIVQDVVNGHHNGLCCTLYMEARRRLAKAEENIDSPKYQSLDRVRYEELKQKMLDIHSPEDPDLPTKLRDLGMNPTGAIDYDNSTRFYLNTLTRKNWRSSNDKKLGKTVAAIGREMSDTLRSNPKTAFTVSRYLPAIIDYYCESRTK
jgi:hypothetical protein